MTGDDFTKPTSPRDVCVDTPLLTLNLNWREKDLPEAVRTKHVHRLHPYLGKFIPQLVEVFLRKYFQPGQTVLDPFCGSGTTLVQANELGINSIGYDVSAFNVLLCRAKTDHYDLVVARSEVLDVLEHVRESTQADELQPALFDLVLPGQSAPRQPSEYLERWFAPRALRELLSYRHFIESGAYRYSQLLQIILSRSARSARLTTHFDLDFPKRPQVEPYWCYKHSRQCQPTTGAFGFLRRYSLDTLARIAQFAALRTTADVVVQHADATAARFPFVHGVVTSPPYVGLIDYHAQHTYSYELLGLEDNRNKEIGSAANGSSKKAARQYQEQIADVFRRAAEAMVDDGRFVVVANDRANLYSEIATLAGLEVEDVLQRQVNRRTGRRATQFQESVFVWRKPRSLTSPC